MGGWASILFFCSGRAGGRRDFVVENRVGVGGRPGTPGPVGGPDTRLRFRSKHIAQKRRIARAPELVYIMHILSKYLFSIEFRENVRTSSFFLYSTYFRAEL